MTKVGFRRSMEIECYFIANFLTLTPCIIVNLDELLVFGSKKTISDVKKIRDGLFTITYIGE